jgi:hypothetical protein
MNVALGLYASFTDYPLSGTPGQTFPMEIDEGISIGKFLEVLKIPADIPKSIFPNGLHAQENEVITKEDRVAAFPLISGGALTPETCMRSGGGCNCPHRRALASGLSLCLM